MHDPRIRNRAARRFAARGRKKSLLATLSAAALSLFASGGPAGAEFPIRDIEGQYSFSFYKENPLAGYKLESGSDDRYEVESHQFLLKGQITDRIDAGVDIIYESMSGSTPWYVTPGSSQDVPLKVAMTGATVSDERIDVSAHSSFYTDRGRIGALFGVSDENDYRAYYFGFNGDRSYNDKNTTLSASLSFSFDEITPTGGGTGDRVKRADKDSTLLVVGFSQNITRSTILQTNLNYRHSKGFLSDPYKRAWILFNGGFTVPDSRPRKRDQISWLTQLRQHIEPIDASIHFDYQYYWDDWDVTGHTFTFNWYQNFFGDLWQVVPVFRYTSQSQPFFYGPVYAVERPDGLATSDYRLSPFGAFMFGLRTQVLLTDWPDRMDWRLGLSYERYLSSGRYALQDVEQENPALVNFHFVYVTLGARF